MSLPSFDYSQVADGVSTRMPLDLIDDLPFGNSRKKRDPKKFEELKDSIKLRGIIQSLVVRPSPSDDKRFEICAGYGRRQAAIENDLHDVPVIIKFATDEEAFEIQMEENVNREDLSIVDEIDACQRYVSMFNGDYDEASRRLGWPVKRVRARLLLATLSAHVKTALEEGQIKLGHAEILCQFPQKRQELTLPAILKDKWTVEYLRQRAMNAETAIKYAKFDTTDCNGCPRNSDVQASLLVNNVGKGMCADRSCWNKKTES